MLLQQSQRPQDALKRGKTTQMRCSSPLSRCRAPQKLPKKEFELSECCEFSNSRKLRETQGIRHRRTSDRGAFLMVRFLWASKENE
jgi:hypothetical protein